MSRSIRPRRVAALVLGAVLSTAALTRSAAAQGNDLLLARSDGGASFSTLLKYQVEINDPVRFVLTREKDFKLRKEQRDSLRNLQRTTDRDRNRVIRELERRHGMSGGLDLQRIPLTATDIALVDSVMNLTVANRAHVLAVLDSAQVVQYQEERAAFRPRILPTERRTFTVDRMQPPPR